MSRRRMTRPQCKEVNTFIHAKKQEVVKVCSQNPLVKNLHQSNHTFRLTVCELKGRSTHKPCQYRGRDKVRTIIVACKDKKPVHLGK
ncbi:ANGI protein, partial [Amia calva]|nr:ANGI protein [Amia calva]